MPSHDQDLPQLNLVFEEPRPTRRIWPVRELVGQIRELVEQEYIDVWVEGEISNFRPAPSGHIYFTLKDADAQLPIVLFRRQAMLLRFRPEDGLHVLVRGRVSVYEQRGQLQLVAETMEPVGAGSLQLAFEQLKERLKAEGLFDSARKRPLPPFPRTVGIVTSPTGAVIRDFLNVVARRHSGLNVLLYPVSVQGDSASAEIERALTDLNVSGRVDLIVLARGGGSLEDLAAFNSEQVARAIASSSLPVVSAIGHETDFTIADFVADLRAPTPSAAAELVTAAQHRIAEHVATQSNRLDRGMRLRLLQAQQCLSTLRVDRAESRVTTLLHRSAQRLDDLAFRFESAIGASLRNRRTRIDTLTASCIRHDPRQAIAQARMRLINLHSRLDRSFDRALKRTAFRLGSLDARLRALSPLSVLDRGYALVFAANGAVVRSSSQLSGGDIVNTRLAEGSFTSRVENSRVEDSQIETSGTKSLTPYKTRTPKRKSKT
jgi:exodeoxyribonuclease VII large subunit